MTEPINLATIFSAFRWKICLTWLLVLAETVGIAFIPLAMGVAIDGLLEGNPADMVWLGGLLLGVTALATLRRMYDTRTYGTIRIRIGEIIHAQTSELDISTMNARLDMGRELADFLEEELPNVITAVVQMIITLAVLCTFDLSLTLAALLMTMIMILIYALFHPTLFRCNTGFNSQQERQVMILAADDPRRLRHHLNAMKRWEVRLSDGEALMFGLTFIAVTGYVLYSLWASANLDDMTAGKLFTVLSYTWEYVEASIALPSTLLFLTRIEEISERLCNTRESGKPSPPDHRPVA